MSGHTKAAAISLWLLFLSLSSANAEVRIGLFQKELPLEVRISNASGFTVIDRLTKKVVQSCSVSEDLVLSKSQLMVAGVRNEEYRLLIIRPIQEGSWFRLTTEEGGTKEFVGSFEVEARPRELQLVNIVPDEIYLYSIVSNEIQSQWPLESLKAQAVVSRSYLYRNLGRHNKDGYDFCDLSHCQVYRAGQEKSERVRQALAQTEGQVILYKGSLAHVFYHSTCGGHTASNQDVWDSESVLAYSQGKPDSQGGVEFCQRSPYFNWNVEIANRQLDKVLQAAIKGGADTDRFSVIEILRKDQSGRVLELRVSSNGVQFSLSGEDLYRAWGRSRGWHELKSTCFEIIRSGDRTAFIGKGLGHGVGMCQWGAKGMAENGASYREILAHYFSGAEVGPMPKGSTGFWHSLFSRFR